MSLDDRTRAQAYIDAVTPDTDEPMHPLDDLIDAGAFDEQPSEPDEYVPLDMTTPADAHDDLVRLAHAEWHAEATRVDPWWLSSTRPEWWR